MIRWVRKPPKERPSITGTADTSAPSTTDASSMRPTHSMPACPDSERMRLIGAAPCVSPTPRKTPTPTTAKPIATFWVSSPIACAAKPAATMPTSSAASEARLAVRPVTARAPR